MEQRILAIAGTAVIVSIVKMGGRQAVRRELRARRMDRDLVNGRVYRVRFSRGIKEGQPLAVERLELGVGVGRKRQCFHANNLAADHYVIAGLQAVPGLDADAARHRIVVPERG